MNICTSKPQLRQAQKRCTLFRRDAQTNRKAEIRKNFVNLHYEICGYKK
jgi:hypothetical protein